MKFNVKDVKSWANRHDVKIGEKGYFINNLGSFKEDRADNSEFKIDRIKGIRDDFANCFISVNLFCLQDCFPFFLPLKAVKKEKQKEKKYRPLKSIDEMDCLFDCSVMSAKKNFITYRSKVTGEIYIELLFAVSRDKNDVLISINNIPVQDLFDNFEIRKNGEWVPFGVEVKENDE